MKKENTTIRISAKFDWRNLQIKELFEAKYLVRMMVKRNLVVQYKQTILGPLWHIMNPLIYTLMYIFVFGGLANLSTDGIPQPLFYLSNLLLWDLFTENLNKCSTTMTVNKGLFGKVYFPRLASPVSEVISSFFRLGIRLSVFVIFLIYYIIFTDFTIRFSFELLPILILLPLQVALLSSGVGLFLTTLTVKYRDLIVIIPLLLQVWRYASPVVYPLSVVTERMPQWDFIFYLNPMSAPLEIFRFAFFGKGTFDLHLFALNIFLTIVIAWIGLLQYHRVGRNFIDRA